MSAMTESRSDAAASASSDAAVDIRREAYTMALYVSVCLLAALSAIAALTGRVRLCLGATSTPEFPEGRAAHRDAVANDVGPERRRASEATSDLRLV